MAAAELPVRDLTLDDGEAEEDTEHLHDTDWSKRRKEDVEEIGDPNVLFAEEREGWRG